LTLKTSTHILFVLSLSLLFGACAVAERVSSPGFDAERLDRIDAAIQREIDAGKIPGAVALVMRDGQVVYHKSFGFADVESGTPMQTDSLFRIASMTKAVTTVAVMTLYEQGYFRLNDPVSKYIPEFSNMTVVDGLDDAGNVTATIPATKPIRIIDLLTHTSGLSYPFIASKVQKSYVDAGIHTGPTASDTKLQSQMKLLASQPLLFEPGSAFAYGLNTDLAGYLVEVMSGKTLAEYFAEEIFGPLGMPDTYFYVPDNKAARLVTLYAAVADGVLVVSRGDESDLKVDNPRFPVEGARTYYSGGAGLTSTAEDYGRFLQMLLNDGELDGVRVLGRKSVELMRTARVDWDGDDVPDFGLGFAVVSNMGKRGELSSAGAYAWGGAFNTSYWIDPAENLIGVYMSQARPTRSDLGDRFGTLVYQALK